MLGVTIRKFTLHRFTPLPRVKKLLNRDSKYLCVSTKGNTTFLQDRFIKFFRSSPRYKLYTSEDECDQETYLLINKYDNRHLKESIGNMNIGELLYFIRTFDQGKFVQPNFMGNILQSVDDRCKELCNANLQLTYKCIDAWYYLCQGNVVTRNVYIQFVNSTFIRLDDINQLEELIYIMFYTSMLKNSLQSQKIIKKCLIKMESNAHNLTVDELCIMISSSFKASVKIKSKKILGHVSLVTNNNLQSIVKDSGYLSTIVKGLRYARFHDIKLMDKMGNTNYSQHILNMNLIAKIHILALYADALYDKQDFVQLLILSCFKDVSSHSIHVMPRLKDLSRLLWAVSYLGYKIPDNDTQNIIDLLSVWLHEERRNAGQLVSCLLSLWTLGCKTPAVFNAPLVDNLTQMLKASKVFRSPARLSLLLTCIQIEMPEMLSNKAIKWERNNIIPQTAIERQLKNRVLLSEVYKIIIKRSKLSNIHVMCGCFLPNINIVGITIQSPAGKILHIEVLDKVVCLRNTNKPHGIMNLKLHLLEKLGHTVLTIPENKFHGKNQESEMSLFLEGELKKLEMEDTRIGKV